MQRLFIKLFLATAPVLFVLAIYFYNDPFKVLYHYDSYFPTDGVQYVVLNKDHVSTQTFVNNYPKYHYDSYIFGNSRSMYYYVAEWKKHIHSDWCFHFDASGESLYGIERKFRFLHDRGVPIKNALIVFDAQACSITKNVGEAHILKKDPLLSGQSKFDFEADCLKAFFDVHFLSAYLRFLFTHKVSSETADKLLLNTVDSHYDVATNEESFPKYEELIARNRDSFYVPRMHLFYKRDTIQKYSEPVIKDEQKQLFYNIKKILDEDKTRYRFVISPLYDQVKFAPADLAFLGSVFGKENVYDFSGINNITQSMYNYYENSHYRPFIANMIMDSIYKTYNPVR